MPERDIAAQRRVHRLAILTVAATLGLILAGALVTSRDAGLAVPDWPLSFGSVNPPRWYAIVNVRTEHGHRIAAASVAVLTLMLGLAIRRHSHDRTVRLLGVAAVFFVLLQAALGGLRVLNLSIDLAMVHGWLGQMFLCVLVGIVTKTASREFDRNLAASARKSLPWGIAVTGAVFAQLVLGIFVRHHRGGLIEYAPFLAHVALAFGIVWLAVRLRQSDRSAGSPLRPWPTILVATTCLQIVLGICSFAVVSSAELHRQASMIESWLPSCHVVLGASVLATSVAILLRLTQETPAGADVAFPTASGEVTSVR
jgi:cytochrome c oxidase assembly protein subunit 15